MRKLLCALACLMLIGFQSNASHLAGGELTYSKISGSNYVIKLVLFRDCAGTPMPASANVVISSVSQSSSFSLTMQKTSTQQVTVPCPGGTNKCINPTSPIPGYEVATYYATVAIPAQANDWVFSHTASARNSSNNITGGNLYLYATLNNLIGENNNATTFGWPPTYLPTNNAVTIPIHTVDADGDSVTITRVAPQVAANTNATYSPGYSVNTPLGSSGTYTINNTPVQTMTLQSTTTGNFTLAYVVHEFRNGTLIASYVRDFICSSLPVSGGNFTYPQAATSNTSVGYACPGGGGSVSLNFFDQTSTDSVYIEVDTPSAPGWSFVVNTTNGTPSAGTNISWTAPSNLNPATTPYLWVTLKARDNACPRNISEFGFLIRTQQCPADSVWPGDANDDNIANLLDVLYVGIGYGQTGPARPNASINWVAQWAQDWNANYPFSNVNLKHGDCNGDGTINASDLGAIAANYGLTHQKGGPRSKSTGDPNISVDLAGIKLMPGATVSIPIILGSSADPINDIYGIATNIGVNGINLGNQATITTNTSWLQTNPLEFSYPHNNGNIDWAISRTNGQNTSGNGTIGMLNLEIPTNAVVGSSVSFDFSNTTIVNKDGQPITAFNELSQTATIQPLSIAETGSIVSAASVVPNPSGNSANLLVYAAGDAEAQLRVMDITGKLVYSAAAPLGSGSNYIALPAATVARGVYTIQLTTGNNTPQTIKWVKQ